VLREAPDADVRVIPLPFVRRGREVWRKEARAELDIAPDAFVLGCLGYMRESRLLPVVLRAFEEWRRSVPHAEMVLVGEFNTPEQESFLGGRLRSLKVRRPGHVSDAEFEMWGVACDVVVNLRYPSAGEMSGVAVRMMGLGVPVILTDNAENAAFPDDACLKLPHDEREEALLIEYLLALAGNPELGQAIGENARDYIRREHDLDRIVDAYLEAL
jgi:glycosyltransferase involved in cell wall biosynthesis